MTAARVPTRRTSFTSPVIDYEPAPIGLTPPAAPCPSPSAAALHRHTPRPLLRSVPDAPAPPRAQVVPRAAAVFADTALRRILEVADRRRPAAQLRPLIAPTLVDAVTALMRAAPGTGAAVLRRVRLQPASAVDGEATAAELFATYTRGPRVRAIAGRIELVGGRWVITALQIG